MTNDELEAVRARHGEALKLATSQMMWASKRAQHSAVGAIVECARDVPALLDEVERLRKIAADVTDDWLWQKAARAEAHAERLAASLKLSSDWLERRTWGHPADCDALDGSDDIIADARQALSAYREVKDD